MEQPKFKASKEIKFLEDAYATTAKFVATLKIDKKNPMYMHAKMVLDDKNFKKDIKKTIKKESMLAEDAARKVADEYSEKYSADNADMMSEGADFDGDALVKQIKALKKQANPSSHKQIKIATYLSNVLKPISNGTDLIVNTNKVFQEKEPTIAVQTKIYKKVLEANPDVAVSFVLLNIDAINEPNWLNKITKTYGHNSLLVKGIRLGYINQPLITHQIQAIIKASQYSHKPVTILLPMVSANEEFIVLQNVVKSLYAKEKGRKGTVEVSILFEAPSMVMDPSVVFANVNKAVLDLDSVVQYTLGIERNNRLFPHLNQPLNSSVLRQVRNIIREAKIAGKEIWIQGRTVNEPEVLCALIGIGAKHIIVSRYNVDETKELIKKLDVPETYELIANNSSNKIADDTQKAIEQYLDTIE